MEQETLVSADHPDTEVISNSKILGASAGIK